MADIEKIEFQAEIKQILDLVIHSLYTHREIFLRELISNSSDAIDKLRYEALTHHDWAPQGGEYKIRIDVDKAQNTLTISDNGIGMSRDEIIANIGTIAKSGSKEFLKALKEKKDSSAVELIGQFGVGFYSSFMVADKVSLLTRRAGEEKAHRWESTGDGSYTIEETDKAEIGTSVTLSLKPHVDAAIEESEERESDFTEEWTIRKIVRKYSDFITVPITMIVQRDEPALDSDGKAIAGADRIKVFKEETLNSMKAIWARSAKEITNEEYDEFYKHLSHDWEAPLKVIHFSAEGLMEYQALLYIPSHPPFDMFMPTPERRHGIHLYAKRVFIMDDCRELMPEYLRFIKGLVDSADFSLNVSRETIQQNRQITQIRNRLVKKTLDMLAEMKEKDNETYLKFWDAFGKILKEGLFSDEGNRDKLKELLCFESTADLEKLSTLRDYVARMKAEQKAIYYLTGESRKTLENSPHLEFLKEKGFEVIFLTDPVDEFAISHVAEYDSHPLKSAGKGELDVEETGETKKKDEDSAVKYGSLLEFLTGKLKSNVKEVRLSHRLKSSAVCLVTEEHGVAAHVEKLLKQSGQAVPEQKRILELNPDHPLTARMQEMFDRNRSDPQLDDYAYLLYGQGALAEGVPLPDPVRYANLVAAIMAGQP